MWPQGFLHCSPSPRGADSAQWISETSPGSRDGLWRHHSHPIGTLLPLSLKLEMSGGQQPVSAMAQLAEDQAGILSSWQDLLQPLGCSASPWMGLAGTSLQNLGFLQCFDTPPWDLWERHTQHICRGGEENICWKSSWIGASSSDFFKISPRSKNSKCTNLQRMMGYFEGYVGSGSQHQGRESRAFCWISAKTWLGTVICITLYSPES